MKHRRSRLIGIIAVILVAMGIPGLSASALEPGTSEFHRTWERTDQPVAGGAATRSWMWGPSAFTANMYEPYEQTPGGLRVVQYFDKSRMEITNPSGDRNSKWYVTNGLLATELVTGRMQLGDALFDDRKGPANVNVAGDADDASGPTYASFTDLRNAPAFADGATLTRRVNRAGQTSEDPTLAGFGVTAGHYVSETKHQVASVFWNFMNAQGTVYENGNYTTGVVADEFYATGLPITEAYWANVKVNNEYRDVLMQVFERRVLTYTPNNPAEWQVEMGNVGLHYYMWRYEAEIPAEPPAIELDEYLWLGPAPIYAWQPGEQADPVVTFGNQSPYVMSIKLQGETNRTITLAACEDCIVYPSEGSFSSCRDDIEYKDVTLPAGNYRVEISFFDPNVVGSSGHWTLVPDAQYGSCYAVVQQPSSQQAQPQQFAAR